MYEQRNTEALSSNYCCRKQYVLSISLSACASVGACMRVHVDTLERGRVHVSARVEPYLSSMDSACAALYRHFLPLCLLNIFRRYLINTTIFGGKKVTEHKCVFWFSLQLLSKTLRVL